jgi:hypothetical protein
VTGLRSSGGLWQAEPLIRVEIAPGRFVQCHARDKEKVLERYRGQQGGRRHGRT